MPAVKLGTRALLEVRERLIATPRAVEPRMPDEPGEPPLPDWIPHQLRRLRLREIRTSAGLAAAQASAGHSEAAMTDHDAPPKCGSAARAALANW
jgi:hypothetical protein